MKFTYQGVEYRIEFQHLAKKSGKKKVRNSTIARIKTGHKETEQVIVEGKVNRYHYDKFNKEEARKYALDAMLKNLVAVGSSVEDVVEKLQAFRSAARKAYHTRPGGLDYTAPVQKVQTAATVSAQ